MSGKLTLPQAWDQTLARATQRPGREGAAAALLLGLVETRAVHVLQFGLAVEVRALPPGAIEPLWLTTGDGPLLTRLGLDIWNRLMAHAHDVVEGWGAPGDLAAVVLHPAAEDLAAAQLRAAASVTAEKRDAA